MKRVLVNVKPVLTELLDRLEAVEKERDSYKFAFSEYSEKTEWVQQGINDGTVSAKYLGWHRADVMSDLLRAAEKERDALRAKIEAMERQDCSKQSMPAEVSREFVMDAIAQALGDAYDCTRVWSAWGYGTMSHDDFQLIAEDGDRLREIADAAIMAMGASAPKPCAQPAPSVPDGWLRAIDEALVVANIGVANESDTYEQAKAKLDSLISFHVDVATDPAVNGGWKLVPIEPTQEMSEAGVYAGSIYYDVAEATYEAMLAAAPEAKL